MLVPNVYTQLAPALINMRPIGLIVDSWLILPSAESDWVLLEAP